MPFTALQIKFETQTKVKCTKPYNFKIKFYILQKKALRWQVWMFIHSLLMVNSTILKPSGDNKDSHILKQSDRKYGYPRDIVLMVINSTTVLKLPGKMFTAHTAKTLSSSITSVYFRHMSNHL